MDKKTDRWFTLVYCLMLLIIGYDELVKQVVLLPVCINTLKTLKKKEELDKEIARVEEAMKIFSYPKVYIKKDV